MTGHHSKRSPILWALSAAIGLAGILLLPRSAIADEQTLTWARIDFLRNRVQLVPSNESAREARIADFLSIGDALRTARAARAELRFNDGSLARIGERATFRFTPNTRNFQLTNGTVLLLIPPNIGRSTIQTPNAVTGIQGSALFVRYIPETNTTIVGALTDNPDGPMVLFNRDGSERQALRANEIGVVENGQITQIYQFNSELFWQTSGLAQGFNYLQESSSTGSDALDAVRQEIRDAIAKQGSFTNDDQVIENPPSFSRPDLPAAVSDAPAAGDAAVENVPVADSDSPSSENANSSEAVSDVSTPANDSVEVDLTAAEELEFEGSAAEAYLSEPNPSDPNAQPLSNSSPDATATEESLVETDTGQDASSERADTVLDESVEITELDEQNAVDGAASSSTPGRIRRNGSSSDDDAPTAEVSVSAPAPVIPAPAPATPPLPPVAPGPASSLAPVLDPSTTLELTVDANRPGSSAFTPPNESIQSSEPAPNTASPVQPEGARAGASPAFEPPSASATTPDLYEQETVPINRGAPLPELSLIEDAPIMREAMGEPHNQEDDHTANGAETPPVPDDNSVTEGATEEGVIPSEETGNGLEP